jgi:TetR/AcrR family transcriptional regulator, transcriptional repressor for nem operon
MARPRQFDPVAALDKAAEAFRARGFEGTSIEDLEKATGLRRASLYGAYGDKKALYLAALRRYDAAAGAALQAELDARPSGRAALERLFAAVLEAATVDPCGCLLANAANDGSAREPGVARCLDANRRRMEGQLLAQLLRGRADGSLKLRLEPRAASRFLFAVILGLRTLAKTGAGRDELAEVARAAMGAL